MHTLASSCSKIKKNLKDKNQRAAKQDFSRAKKGAESLYHNMPTAEEQKQCEVTAWLLLVKAHKSRASREVDATCHSQIDSPAATSLKEAAASPKRRGLGKSLPTGLRALLLTPFHR